MHFVLAGAINRFCCMDKRMILVETLHTIVILFNGICFKIDCYLYTKHILSYFWFVFGSFFFSLCYWFQFDFSTWPERAIACSKIVFIVNVLLIAFAFAFSVILNWISSTLVILSKRHSFNVYTKSKTHTRAQRPNNGLWQNTKNKFCAMRMSQNVLCVLFVELLEKTI